MTNFSVIIRVQLWEKKLPNFTIHNPHQNLQLQPTANLFWLIMLDWSVHVIRR